MSTYSVTWIETSSTELEGHDWIMSQAPDEASLSDVVEMCKAHGVKAKLSNEQGFLKFWVFADGNYQSA